MVTTTAAAIALTPAHPLTLSIPEVDGGDAARSPAQEAREGGHEGARGCRGGRPGDIFVRWKPLHVQPIGWEPDLNDDVRLNIRPFMTVPDVAPWYHLGPEYGGKKGDRINDHHLTLEEKRRARREAGKPSEP